MKKGRTIKLLLAVSLLLSLILGGCKKEDEGPDDVPIALTPAGDVIDRYKKDTTDYSRMPLEDTRIVRLHYRRNDDIAFAVGALALAVICVLRSFGL